MGSYGENGTLDVDTLKSNISAHIPEATVEGDAFPITVTLDGKIFTIDADGNVELAESIEAGDIATNPDTFKKVTEGKVLNYGNTLKVTDAEGNQVNLDVEWKVFYAEGNDIYLIASDYVPVSKLASQKASLGFTDNGNYNIYWNNSSDFKVISIDTAIASRFMLNELSKFTNPSYPNYKMTACLLDASKWDTFRDTRWVDENNVIGGPTLEMYTASWNKKYPSNKLYTNTSSTGYYVGTTEHTAETPLTTTNVSMSSTPGYKDTLYYPHTSGYNNCYGYWLASPSARDSDSEMNVHYSGGVSHNSYHNINYGVRPLVHLKSGIKLKSQGKDFMLVSE